MPVISTIKSSTCNTSPRLLSMALEQFLSARTVYWYQTRESKYDISDAIDNDVVTIAHLLAARVGCPAHSMARCVEYVFSTVAWSLKYRATATVYTGFITVDMKRGVSIDEEFRRELIRHAGCMYPETLVTDRTFLWGEVPEGASESKRPIKKSRFVGDLAGYTSHFGIRSADLWADICRGMRNLLLQRGILHCPDCVFRLSTAKDNMPPVVGVHSLLGAQEYPVDLPVLAEMIGKLTKRGEIDARRCTREEGKAAYPISVESVMAGTEEEQEELL
jgi:hypothetical protein